MNGSLTINLKWLALLLALALIGVLIWTKPWSGTSQRTISVTGQATIEAVPDEYQLNATYQKNAATTKEANDQVAVIGNEVITKLKGLGLDEKQIKTSVNTNPTYDSRIVPEGPGTPTGYSASYMVTVTTKNKEQAQKVQDYLATTPVQYNYSPTPSFSKEAQTKLESEARAKALTNAKQKAEQTAKELGVRVGKVVTVSEVNQIGGPIPLIGKDMAVSVQAGSERQAGPIIEPGSQEYTFSLTVTYAIR